MRHGGDDQRNGIPTGLGAVATYDGPRWTRRRRRRWPASRPARGDQDRRRRAGDPDRPGAPRAADRAPHGLPGAADGARLPDAQRHPPEPRQRPLAGAQSAHDRANELLAAEGKLPIGHMTPHTLRRTFASDRSPSATSVPRRAMYLMGHTDPTLTLGVYQQVMDVSDHALDLLEDLIGCSLDEAKALFDGGSRRSRRGLDPGTIPERVALQRSIAGEAAIGPRNAKGPRFAGLSEERMKGLEPSTFCMASRRSSQLSYIRATAPSIAGPIGTCGSAGTVKGWRTLQLSGGRGRRCPVPRTGEGRRRTGSGPSLRAGCPGLPGGRMFWIIVLSLLAVNYLGATLLASGREPAVRIPYNPAFLEQVDKGNVKRISTQGATVDGEFKKEIRYPDDKAEPAMNFETEIPSFEIYSGHELTTQLISKGVEISAEPINDGRGFLTSLLLGFGPVILLVFLFIWLSRRASGGQMGALGAFGRSKARRVEGDQTKVTFKDVAGIDESKGELAEVVDFLKNPEKYQKLGGRIPRGVLLAGRPGTGKTLLARAVAGEAGVPFFSRLRLRVRRGDRRHRRVAACATSSSRPRKPRRRSSSSTSSTRSAARRSAGNTFGGGNDEREQTLNQILTEMDGFEQGDTVIVVGATNRAEILDAALLRPGRFDRRVTVPAPDKDGRRKILEVHTRSLPLDTDVDLDHVAAITPGHGRRGHRQPGQRGGVARGPARAREGAAPGLHRQPGEDHPGRAARDRALRGGEAPHGLPRGGARDRRHAHAGRRPGAQGLDHPAHDEPRRDDLEPGLRAHELRRRVPRRPDPGRARRPDRRGDRLRLDLGGRGVRHPAADRDRAPDGRPLGDEPGDRPDRGDPVRGPGPAAAGRVRGLASPRRS